MRSAEWVEPYGGSLVNLVVDFERSALLKEIAFNLPDIILNDHQLCDLELLATGVFSPLEGFMTRADYESVLDRMRLQNDLLWPIPISLDVSETQVRRLEGGQSVALRDPEGFLLGVMHIEDIWPVERDKEATRILRSLDPAHPGVRYRTQNGGDYYLGEARSLDPAASLRFQAAPPEPRRDPRHL